MFCSKCGKELSDDAKFCTSCGAPAVRADEAPTVTPPTVTPPAETPPAAGAPVGPPDFTGAPKRRMSVPLLVGIILLGVVVLAAVIIVPIILTAGTANKNSQRRSCQANLRTVDSAIMTYVAMSPEELYPESLEDLVDAGVLKSIPTCPSGDKPYIWVEAEVGEAPYISCPNCADHTL